MYSTICYKDSYKKKLNLYIDNASPSGRTYPISYVSTSTSDDARKAEVQKNCTK